MGQYFKSIYFSGETGNNQSGKTITVAFNESERELYDSMKHLSNEEIREIIDVNNYEDLIKKAERERRKINQLIKLELERKIKDKKLVKTKDVTFAGSKKIPFQRWYPYIEGYSPDFVKYLIERYCPSTKCIYDPFAGTGTTFFSADSMMISSCYSEINPLLVFINETKIQILKLNPLHRQKLSDQIEKIRGNIFSEIENRAGDTELKESFNKLFGNSKYFDDKTLEKILKIRSYINEVGLENDILARSIMVAVLASLIPVSFLKKAGDVRFKTAKEKEHEKVEIKDVLLKKLKEISEDIRNFDYNLNTEPQLILFNAKKMNLIKSLSFDAIITSPPYLNGTNYFRNTKLELWFLKYIREENDLRLFRDQVLTSGINDVSAKKNGISSNEIFKKSPILNKLISDLNKKSYDKRIPIMVLSYFEEMEQVFSGVRKHLSNDSDILIDIGDSIFAGIHVRTDKILIEILEKLGYSLKDEKLLRKRRSRNKEVISQVLLAFKYKKDQSHAKNRILEIPWVKNWKNFKKNIPHQKEPFAKRNWGHGRHSLCSYQGKLKASIAHHLVETFVPKNGKVLDPFCGVGSIPLEASLNGRFPYGIDISLPAYYISSAKIAKHNRKKCFDFIKKLEQFIKNNDVDEKEIFETKNFGFNKKIADYYEKNTLKEILSARKYFSNNPPRDPEEMLIISALLHILHGNRPYALSRRSHPIVPYAPQGDFVYKSLVKKLTEKIEKTLAEPLSNNFLSGKIYNLDSTEIWPQEINNLDAIITSPPFFDSTRFHLANWIRLWFSGWSESDFKWRPNAFVEEKQKQSFSVYDNFFRQSRERLKQHGVLVMHLGKSAKCNMANELTKAGSRWFKKIDAFDESVSHCESHGIRDKGTVTEHQYLILA